LLVDILTHKQGIENAMSNKRLLFIPVSSPEGIGEYMRSLMLAQSLNNELPNSVDIHFILNKHAAYAAKCPFPATLLENSATKEVDKVCAVIAHFSPDIVVFDCAGRASQMKAAKRMGAKVVFISQHAKKRAKGLKLNRSNLIDAHWVVQPDFCIEPLSWIEKAKIKFFPVTQPQNMGAMTTIPNDKFTARVLEKYKVERQSFFIVNAGSGGHIFGEQRCADIFYTAALTVAKKTGFKGVVIFGPNYTGVLPQSELLHIVSELDSNEFIALMSAAKTGLLSAGDTLLQAINVALPCVAAAVSKDQPARLDKCVKTGLVFPAKLTIESLSHAMLLLFQDENYQSIKGNINKLPTFDSQRALINALTELVFTPH
jgi:spore coat polysaccharide biosynthesis predicted glycosyltransferase SpsG